MPERMARLELPRYGSEHLLICRESKGSTLLPLLLEWSDGDRLERELATASNRGPKGVLASMALNVALAGRRRFFEAVGCNDVPRRVGDDLTAVLLRTLEMEDLRPISIRIVASSENGAVRYMDMGANTPAAPAGVALAPASAFIKCEEPSGGERVIPLEGAGEAVALALRCADLELTVGSSLWEQHSMGSEEGLPELRAGTVIKLARTCKEHVA